MIDVLEMYKQFKDSDKFLTVSEMATYYNVTRQDMWIIINKGRELYRETYILPLIEVEEFTDPNKLDLSARLAYHTYQLNRAH